MTDPNPGNNTGTRPTPLNVPLESSHDGKMRHEGSWNSFQFDPPLTHEDALILTDRAEELGYRMLFRRADYSFEQVQTELIDRGPSAFLDLTLLQEDISPKEPTPTAEMRMAGRLQKLAPTADLVITDPYLFPDGRSKDSEVYAASLGKMCAPALTQGLRITAVVGQRGNNAKVRAAVEAELHARCRDLEILVIESDDFHDRFWIADRKRGLVVGTSLNKIGRRIFFVDELSKGDVAAVLLEVDLVRGSGS